MKISKTFIITDSSLSHPIFETKNVLLFSTYSGKIILRRITTSKLLKYILKKNVFCLNGK